MSSKDNKREYLIRDMEELGKQVRMLRVLISTQPDKLFNLMIQKKAIRILKSVDAVITKVRVDEWKKQNNQGSE